MSKYENECKEKDGFVRKVLKDWLSRNNDDDHNDSAVPRTWAALADCITDAGLPGKLAKVIRDTFPSGCMVLVYRLVNNDVEPISQYQLFNLISFHV